jgi:acetyltransferase-like isoleucine patch superfamily enzyme
MNIIFINIKMIIKFPIRLFNFTSNLLTLKLNKSFVGENLKVNGRIVVKGENLRIGNNVKINSGKKYNIIGGDTQAAFIIRRGAHIIIGNNVGISNSTFVAMNSIIIEDDVKIGGSCSIYDNDFHAINYQDRILKNDSNVSNEPVLLKKGSFIGAHTIILKGVTIGERAVIGAGSIVTTDVADDEIWAGNPAKKIKTIPSIK